MLIRFGLPQSLVSSKAKSHRRDITAAVHDAADMPNLYDLTPNGELSTDDLSPNDCSTAVFLHHYGRWLPAAVKETHAALKIVVEMHEVNGRSGYYYSFLIGPFDPMATLDDAAPGAVDLLDDPEFCEILSRKYSDYIYLYDFAHQNRRTPIIAPFFPHLKVTDGNLWHLVNHSFLPDKTGKQLKLSTMQAQNIFLTLKDIRSMREYLEEHYGYDDEAKFHFLGRCQDHSEKLDSLNKATEKFHDNLSKCSKLDRYCNAVMEQFLLDKPSRGQPRINSFFQKKV